MLLVVWIVCVCVCVCVCLSVCVSCAKTAQSIDRPFGVWLMWVQGAMYYIRRSPDPPREGALLGDMGDKTVMQPVPNYFGYLLSVGFTN